MKVTIKKLSGVKGYQIKYSTSRKFSKSKTKTITTKKRTVTLKKLKSGKKYYVKVRAYRYNTSKKKVYGKYSKVKVKKVK
ncbi:MAG: fibronectin type III domain-containing protein [bacterium]|nr:fibronectin type III domain-containing protein [bacterium]